MFCDWIFSSLQIYICVEIVAVPVNAKYVTSPNREYTKSVIFRYDGLKLCDNVVIQWASSIQIKFIFGN